MTSKEAFEHVSRLGQTKRKIHGLTDGLMTREYHKVFYGFIKTFYLPSLWITPKIESNLKADMTKKITVSDDFLPDQSTIQIEEMCREWKAYAWTNQQDILFHRYLGLGHIAMAKRKTADADVYFFLADLLEDQW